MATVTHAATAIWTTAAGNKVTAAFTPVAGDLLAVFAPATGVATSAVTDTNADGLGTYVKVGVSRTGFSTAGDLSLWVRNALIGSATSMTVTVTQASSTGGGLDVFRISGMSLAGAPAVRQSSGQSAGTLGTTPAPVMGGAVLTGNPCLGCVCNGTSPATLTPRTSWTEATDLGYATPTSGMETMFRSSGETATTLTWGSTSATAFASLAAEFDSATAAETSPQLEASGFGAFPGVGNNDTINSVTATVNQWQSSTTLGRPTYQLWNGVSGQIGADITGSSSVSTANTDSPQWTGVTYANLQVIRFRIAAHQGGAVAAVTQSVDWVALTVSYTPAAGGPPATVTSPKVPFSALGDFGSQASFA